MAGQRIGKLAWFDLPALGFWLWDVALAGVTVLTCVLVLVADEPPGPRGAAVAVVLLLGAGWVGAGRELALAPFDRVTPGRLAYCLALAAGLVLAVALVDVAKWSAFVVYSQFFWLLPLAPAIAGAVAVTVVLSLATAVVGGHGEVFAPQVVYMTLFAVLIGTVIHQLADEGRRHAQLIAELDRGRTQGAQLSHTACGAAERERPAGEIHDTLAQGFTGIVTLLHAAQARFAADPSATSPHVDRAVRTARENLREAQALVTASAPADLASRSLTDAVGRQAGRLAQETGMAVAQSTSGTPRRLTAETETVLLRAALVLLATAGRRAAAHRVAVELDYADPDVVALTVVGEGAGFDPDAVGEAGYGLRMLRERVERLGGTVTVTSGQSGTRVAVRLPSVGDRWGCSADRTSGGHWGP